MLTTRALPHRLRHALCLADVARERFLAQNRLARFRRRDRDRGMRVVRRADIDDVDIRIVHHRAPIGRGLLPTKLVGCLLHRAPIAAAKRAHSNFRRQLEKARRLAPRIRMGFAHEAVANQGDSKCGAPGHAYLGPAAASPSGGTCFRSSGNVSWR